MDDIIAVFNNEYEARDFLTYLNSKHKNIEFTIECENDKTLNFLDVTLNTSDGKLSTSIYRKSTFTGLLMNYFSFTPMAYKIGLVRCLIDRIYKINNSWAGFDCDLNKLFSILKRNLYPQNLCNKIAHNYLQQKRNIDNSDKNPDDKPPDKIKHFFKLPYVGEMSNNIKHKLKIICERYCKDIEVNIAFQSYKIGSVFSTKDKLGNMSKPMTVYKFCCARCNSCYIGETTKVASVRANEHLFSDKLSAVHKHLLSNPECKAVSDISCFSAIDHAETQFQLKIKQSFHINWENPVLNKQMKHYNVQLSL